MADFGTELPEPYWLTRMRQAAKQRPRTRFVRIRWIELQYLIRVRDALWLAAGPDLRERLQKLRATDDYTYLSLPEKPLCRHPRTKKTLPSIPQRINTQVPSR